MTVGVPLLPRVLIWKRMMVDWWIREGSHDGRGAIGLRGVLGVGGSGELCQLSQDEFGVVGGVSRKNSGSGSPLTGIDTCSS